MTDDLRPAVDEGPATPVGGYGAAAARGVGISLLFQAGARLGMVAYWVIVANHLPPQLLGMVGIAETLIWFIGQFSEMGISHACVYLGDESRRLRTGLLLRLFLGVGMYIVLAAVAPLWAWFYDDARVTHVVWIMGLGLVLGVPGFAPGVRLQRAMRFGRLGWVQVVGVAANLGVMLLLLFHGGSYWSVVAGSLAGVAASTITVRLLGGGGDVRPQWDREEARKILAYGKHLVAAGLLLFLINNADNWIVGKMEGLAVLGLYGMAFRWGNGFVRDFASVVGRVLFPTLTRLREDRARLGAAFVECLTFMALLSTPACLGMLAVAPVLVRDLLGEVWVPCTFALQLWCVYGACRSLGMVNGALLTAAGRPDRIARTSTIFLVVSVLPAFAATWLWGMNGMTCVYVATGFLSLWLALRYSLELLPVGWFEVWCAVRGPVVLSTGMAGVVHLALRCLPGGGLSVLFLSVLVGVVVYAALVASFQRKEVGRLVDLVREGWRRRGEAAA